MIPFGLVFIGMAIYAAVYNHHNATSKDRYFFLILLMKTKRQIRLMKGMERNHQNRQMIILPEQVLASAHIAESRWIPDLIFAQNAEKYCRINIRK